MHITAGDRAADMNAHAADHDSAVNYGDALARLCRRDNALLARLATADYNKVVCGRTHFDDLKSTMPAVVLVLSIARCEDSLLFFSSAAPAQV
jgi:hypothetical protein